MGLKFKIEYEKVRHKARLEGFTAEYNAKGWAEYIDLKELERKGEAARRDTLMESVKFKLDHGETSWADIQREIGFKKRVGKLMTPKPFGKPESLRPLEEQRGQSVRMNDISIHYDRRRTERASRSVLLDGRQAIQASVCRVGGQTDKVYRRFLSVRPRSDHKGPARPSNGNGALTNCVLLAGKVGGRRRNSQTVPTQPRMPECNESCNRQFATQMRRVQKCSTPRPWYPAS